MTTAALVGSTGLTGSHILQELLASPSISTVYAYARRAIPNPTASAKLHPLTTPDTSTWPSLFQSTTPPPSLFFSALGQNRSAPGGPTARRAIDIDLNLSLARAARAAGVGTYVLISTAGADSSSRFAYTRTKGELEDAVRGLGFAHTVILRPMLLVGEREAGEGVLEWGLKRLAGGLGKVSRGLVDRWAADIGVVVRAAVGAGWECVEGRREEGVWVLEQGDIVRLGSQTQGKK
ncbi:NAD dependent epimerase/dehydratase family protein-like protein [Massariosphaeria phaeospora]|uniref:NAD dependent epimerase/dehydratase family protein-like protein n=1 Tax=Massariosphaeria phaeospora TaxID=100035 RepID=A0A7C8MI79_9PLEO|nr:NAD dependent epimerase/dehydratase family protein-like protein [Massariosphaeria phaeospora]